MSFVLQNESQLLFAHFIVNVWKKQFFLIKSFIRVHAFFIIGKGILLRTLLKPALWWTLSPVRRVLLKWGKFRREILWGPLKAISFHILRGIKLLCIVRGIVWVFEKLAPIILSLVRSELFFGSAVLRASIFSIKELFSLFERLASKFLPLSLQVSVFIWVIFHKALLSLRTAVFVRRRAFFKRTRETIGRRFTKELTKFVIIVFKVLGQSLCFIHD